MIPVRTASYRLHRWVPTDSAAILWLAMAVLLGGCTTAEAEKLAEDPLGGIALTTQQGTPLRAEDYRDKTVVLSFFFTSCPVVCPRQVKALAEAWHALPLDVRERVRFLTVSVDPDTDTPEALLRFARKHAVHLDGFTFARASEEATRALTTRLAVFDATRPGGTLPGGHTTAVYLFDPRGRLMQRYGGATDAPRLAREIQQIDTLSRTRS